MTKTKGKLNICSRGHRFYKSSSCPICPTCWVGFYKTKQLSDFPEKLSAPALRALLNHKITKLSDLVNFSEKEIAALHGMGPKGVVLLKIALINKELKFAD